MKKWLKVFVILFILLGISSYGFARGCVDPVEGIYDGTVTTAPHPNDCGITNWVTHSRLEFDDATNTVTVTWLVQIPNPDGSFLEVPARTDQGILFGRMVYIPKPESENDFSPYFDALVTIPASSMVWIFDRDGMRFKVIESGVTPTCEGMDCDAILPILYPDNSDADWGCRIPMHVKFLELQD